MTDTPLHYKVGKNSEQIRSALNLIESLLIEGVRHGHFDYTLTCATGQHGRRLLLIKAGKTHKFTIEETDVPR